MFHASKAKSTGSGLLSLGNKGKAKAGKKKSRKRAPAAIRGPSGRLTQPPPTPTPLPPSLQSIAVQLATSEVQELLRTPARLGALDTLIAQYEQQERVIEAELKTTVESQLRDMRHSVELLEKARLEMQVTKESFSSIATQYARYDHSVQDFAAVQQLKFARVNLKRILQMLEAYTAVPFRVRELQRSLAENPAQLKHVWAEWYGIREWRASMIAEVEASLSAGHGPDGAVSGAGGGTSSNNADVVHWNPSANTRIEMLSVLHSHFHLVDTLGEAIWEQVWARIRNCLVLAQYEPAMLVCAVEVIERTDARHAAAAGADPAAQSGPGVHKAKCEEVLKEAANERLVALLPPPPLTSSSNFAESPSSATATGLMSPMQSPPPQANMPTLQATLQSATSLIFDLRVVADDVVRCFPPPPKYHVLKLFREAYEERLAQVLQPSVNRVMREDASKAGRAGDMLDLVSWMSQYNEMLKDIDGVLDCRAFEAWCELLMEEYVEQAMPRVSGWVDNIVENRENVVEVSSSDGSLFTVVLFDLFHLLSEELTVVGDRVRGVHMLRFFQACISILEQYQQKEAQQMPALELSRACALINDNERAQDLCDSFLALCQDKMDEHSARAAEDAMEIAFAGFLQNATQAVQCVVDLVFDELAEVWLAMFEREWEESLSMSAETVCATLEDYIDHPESGLRRWLAGPYFFGKTLFAVLQRTVRRYVERLLYHPRRFGSIARAAARVSEDHRAFRTFFEAYLPDLRFGGIRSRDELDAHLQVLLSVSAFFADKDAPQAHFEDLASEFGGPHAPAAIKRLVLFHGKVDPKRRGTLFALIDGAEWAVSSASEASRFSLEGLETMYTTPLLPFARDGASSTGPAPAVPEARSTSLHAARALAESTKATKQKKLGGATGSQAGRKSSSWFSRFVSKDGPGTSGQGGADAADGRAASGSVSSQRTPTKKKQVTIKFSSSSPSGPGADGAATAGTRAQDAGQGAKGTAAGPETPTKTMRMEDFFASSPT